MAQNPLTTVTLAGEIDLPGFRREARTLLAKLVPPEDTSWNTQPVAAPAPLPDSGRQANGSTNLFLPRSFLSLCDTVILHSDPARFGLLYRLLWRLVHEPGLRRNPLDADRMQALHMAQAVRRDMQKMKSLIRFKALEDQEGPEPLDVAWFEPDHHIVEAVAPVFARRLVQVRWAILTPARSVRSIGNGFEFGRGADGDATTLQQAGAALWLDLYRMAFPAQGLPAHAPSKQQAAATSTAEDA